MLNPVQFNKDPIKIHNYVEPCTVNVNQKDQGGATELASGR